MITYGYWFLVLAIALGVFFLLKTATDGLLLPVVSAIVLLALGWALYFFHFQQVFVRNWGGVMAVKDLRRRCA